MSEQEQTNLSELSPHAGAKRRRKRVGIGEGSGNGKTCGKGQKGQRSRSGYSKLVGFEGGQMPLHRRLPKRGFTSRKRVKGENLYSLVNVEKLLTLDDAEITLEKLNAAGLLRSKSRKVKIVQGQNIDRKLNVEAHAVTASARAAIEQAGGEIKIVT